MSFRILVQWRKHYWQYGLNIITDQVAEVFIVPEVECSFGDLTLESAHASSMPSCNSHLEMRAGDRFCQLVEERLLNFGELCRIHHLKDVLYFVQEHDLLCAVDFRPISK